MTNALHCWLVASSPACRGGLPKVCLTQLTQGVLDTAYPRSSNLMYLPQLRVHESKLVDFYVRVASGPIVEDCSGLRFAPSGLRYPAYNAQLEVRLQYRRPEYMPWFNSILRCAR